MHPLAQQVQLARQAYARGEHARAVAICNRLMAQIGERSDLLNIKAVSLLAQGQVEDAEVSMRKALKHSPRDARLRLNAANIYKARSQHKLIKRCAHEAIRLAPRDAVVLYQSALLFRHCGDYPRALRAVERCLQIKPDFSHAWHLKGSTLFDLGKNGEAQSAFEKTVELDPTDIRALSALINIRGDRLDDQATVAMLERIQLNGASAADRASAAHALGKMYHHDGQYEAAFARFNTANTLAASSGPFNPDAWRHRIDHIITASAGPGVLTTTRGGGSQNLVFIVGMPRSGTTLCEHVLSANSGVLACGELATMENIEKAWVRRGVDPYRADLANRELEQASASYLASLPGNQHEYGLVTDKAPMNFERLGLIHRVFPQARFLHCLRHPLDTILSCYMQDFLSGLSFSYDLAHLAQVYVDHTRLMRHWMKLLPDLIHVVNYEQFVARQEAETRAMAAFLQLDFEDAMMTPHLQDRAVVTASNVQVRQAVYSSSIGRWKKYRPWLGSAITILQNEGILDPELNCLL